MEAKKYLISAVYVLKENNFPLLILAVIGGLFFMPNSPDKPSDLTFFLPMILLFIVYPLIYGRYTEIIINNRQISYLKIFSTHWFNYFVVSIIVASPILVATFFGIFFKEYAIDIRNILSLSINALTIYVIPLVFLSKKRLSSVSLGIKCLLGNFNFSIPLILLTLFPSVLALAIQNPSGPSDNSLTTFLFNYSFWLLNILFDFVVFIAATLILKEKLLNINNYP